MCAAAAWITSYRRCSRVPRARGSRAGGGRFASGPATAATTCQEQFDLLEAHTQSVAITAGKVDKERTALLKLIEDAEALVALGKTSDSINKLLDYELKVDQLEAAGRISAESAAQLRADAEATIACLESSSA